MESVRDAEPAIVDTEKSKQTRIIQDELILINGVPVRLVGEEAEELKQSILSGVVPSKLLESVLGAHLGEGQYITKVEATLTVKHTQTNKDTTVVKKNGVVVDQKTVQNTEENVIRTCRAQSWHPRLPFECFADGHRQNEAPPGSERVRSCASSSSSSDEVGGKGEGVSRSAPASTAQPGDSSFPALPTGEAVFPDSPGSDAPYSVKHSADKSDLQSLAKNLVRLIAEWTEFFPYDFRDDRLMECLGTVTKRCLLLSGRSHDASIERMLRNLQTRLSRLREYESLIKEFEIDRSRDPPPADLPPAFSASPAELARQLTHIELEQLSHIGPEEFVQAFAKNRSRVDLRDLKRTKNLETYVGWFNRLSFFVATNICKCPKKKHRVKAIEFWIEVGRECFNIGNFNSLMAVLAGLNLSSVTRLKKTWSKVQTAQLEVLEQQMAPSSNFLSYRSTLAAALWRRQGASDDGQRIVVPFFSLLVKDLYFLNEGCAGKLPNGHINFEKCWQLARQVSEFVAWQRAVCPFPMDMDLHHRLQTCYVFSEDELARASFLCENPENTFERERMKSLK